MHITSGQNPQIKNSVRLRESAQERRAQGLFFLEGFRLCADALASGYAPEKIFLTEAARVKYNTQALENAAAAVFYINDAAAQKLASTQNPQGVFGTFKSLNAQPHAQPMPEHSQAAKPHHRWAALENVQDPGNLGAIARTAEALGIDGLVVFGGCDTYHPKALRASMGALLRLPVAQTDDLPAWLRRTPLPCYAAVPDASAQPAVRVDFSQGGVVVIGNEGIGLSDEAIAACDSRVTIPMPGRAESLNAAAAATILLWEMVRCDR